jgi:hypothetical protein
MTNLVLQTSVDFDNLLRSNLERVFNQRNKVERDLAISELFTESPVMYEPGQPVEGREALSEVAGKLLGQFGPNFRFTPQGNGVGHHGFGRCGGLPAT